MKIPNKFNRMGIDNSQSAQQPLTFTAVEDGAQIFAYNYGYGNYNNMQYKTKDSGGWQPYIAKMNNSGPTITLQKAGDTVQFWNNANTLSSNTSQYFNFKITSNKKMNVSGNIMSLLNYRQDVPNYCFYRLFYQCWYLVDAGQLQMPDTVGVSCYQNMFEQCYSLANAPALPATDLLYKGSCYNSMFLKCTSLVNAPAISATTVANNCMYRMFRGCTSLVNVPDLPKPGAANNCYQEIFYGCTSLVNAPAFGSQISVPSACFISAFQGCTSLVNAPALPATILQGNMNYTSMFLGCTSLVNAPALPATELTQWCYQNMFKGCTSLVNAPELPATTLTNGCYQRMFNGCTSLNNIEVNFTDWNASNTCTADWMVGVSATGTFTKPSALTETFGNSNIPSGWTVVNK